MARWSEFDIGLDEIEWRYVNDDPDSKPCYDWGISAKVIHAIDLLATMQIEPWFILGDLIGCEIALASHGPNWWMTSISLGTSDHLTSSHLLFSMCPFTSLIKVVTNSAASGCWSAWWKYIHLPSFLHGILWGGAFFLEAPNGNHAHECILPLHLVVQWWLLCCPYNAFHGYHRNHVVIWNPACYDLGF